MAIISASIQLWHIISIFALIGFVFHYFQTTEYKKSIIGSILIGGILGISLGLVLTKNIQINNIYLLLIPALIGIATVLTGGVIAVGLKKLVNILKRRTKPDGEQSPENKSK